ncbi:MAG: rhodanese-like domain-containing protein [Lentimonas sp.]
MSTNTIACTQLPEIIESKALVIDVRTPAEFRAVHVDGASLKPLDQLDAAQFCHDHGNDEPVYILCKSGKRACAAAEKLAAAGHTAVHVVEGGTDAAIEAGIPVIRGKGAVSIERQVRIVAGALVVAGTLLGSFVHIGFLGIPAFIGSGFVFAGITDTCGMAMMLAKCPWNR